MKVVQCRVRIASVEFYCVKSAFIYLNVDAFAPKQCSKKRKQLLYSAVGQNSETDSLMLNRGASVPRFRHQLKVIKGSLHHKNLLNVVRLSGNRSQSHST